MYKSNKKIIWVGFIVSLFFFSIFILTKDIGKDMITTSSAPPSQIEKEEKEAFLQISGEKIETKINEGENVYDFMTKLREEGKIDFKDETYSGMGKLIKEINGVENGEKNWIYYVNGKKANIGVSNYKLNNGDIVSWKYEKDY